MKKKILGLALASAIAFWVMAKLNPTLAATNVAASSAVLKNEVWEIKKLDYRVEKLEAFLASYKSPLACYASDFIIASDRYGLDWRLLPAITGVESTFGKQIPAGTYNAYGWNNGAWQFTNWPTSIDYVSRALREKYIDQGLNTVAKIGPIYAPPSRTWAGKVTYFMEQIECFEFNSCFEGLTLTL